MNRSIRRLYLVIAAGFGLLVLTLGYWQVIAAGSLADHSGNLQTIQAQREIDRGRILSADGKVLAASRAVRVNGQRVYQRVYPQGTLAANVVGYHTEGGDTGLERFYNRYLTGDFGTEPLLQRLNLAEKRGANVTISIDSRIQAAAEQGLSGMRGAAVALDPRTGAVLAMASSPTFDPGKVSTDFSAISSQAGSPLIDRATVGLYPPGSTFKVVTVTAALESGLYGPNSQFFDTGVFKTPGGPIRNFAGERFGRNTLTTALTNSINTTFARIGHVLGPERLGAAMDVYGFGRRPPIDLPDGEVATSGRYQGGSLLPNGQQGEDAARLAIGQEKLVVTPLQMAMVAAAVADKGTLMAPHLMTRISDRGGATVRTGDTREIAQVASPATAATLTTMMTNVVREGTGTAAALVGLEVAGKTGTAETGVANQNQAWFIGFAPASNPTVAVAVVIEDTPQVGGIVAAPIAASMMRTAIQAGR